MTKIEEKVENLIKQTIKNLGYELYDVIYEKEAQDYYLRVFIDKAEGISLDDCETVNNAITDMLDEADYIKDAYFLEVSSPRIRKAIKKRQTSGGQFRKGNCSKSFYTNFNRKTS